MKLTPEYLAGQITSTKYLSDGVLTLCVLTLKNGFKVVGQSAPLDERNYNAELGEEYAYKDAFNKLWQLEGYFWGTVRSQTEEQLLQSKRVSTTLGEDA